MRSRILDEIGGERHTDNQTDLQQSDPIRVWFVSLLWNGTLKTILYDTSKIYQVGHNPTRYVALVS